MQDLWKANEQRNLAPLAVPGAASAGSVRVVSGSGFRYVIPFPYRLHEMLSTVDTEHDSSIVSWLPDGKHFKVHDPRRFVESVIPSAFKQKSLKSFQRQLHLYGFQRVHEGPDKGAYYHEKFLRDNRDLCLTITRAKAPKRSRAASAKTSKDAVKQPAKLPAFHSSAKGAESGSEAFGVVVAQPTPIATAPAVAISPSIFDEDSLPDQSVPIAEGSYGTRGPLHEAANNNPPVPSNCSSLPRPDPLRASASQYNTQRVTYTQQHHHQQHQQQQQGRTNQQLEGSVVETCQWLINAGVPMSAFDPVAINEITDYTPLCVPELEPSPTSSFSPVVPRGPTIPKTVIANVPMMNNARGITVGNIVHGGPQQPMSNVPSNNNNNSKRYQPNPSHSLGFPAYNNSFSTLSTFHGGDVSFDTDHLLTDLLPGEDLPLVDDSLWAL